MEYQLEDNELAAEPLPSGDERHSILFYESAEGGAGVLHRLVDDPGAFARVSAQALQLCHFDPLSGEDLRHAPNAKEDCEAACYDCLISYSNQMDHRHLDRQTIKQFLLQCSQSTSSGSPLTNSRAEHYQSLLNLCKSNLKREWLYLIEKVNCRLPSHAQPSNVTITYPTGNTLELPRSMVSEAIHRLQANGVLTLDEVHGEITDRHGPKTDRLMAVLRELPGVTFLASPRALYLKT